MKKINIILLIFIILCVFSYNSYASTCNDEAYFTLKESTVELIIKNGNNVYRCTGIIIDKDDKSTGVLTAQHCVDQADDVVIDWVYHGSIIYAIESLDIAYIKINESMRHKNAIKLSPFNAQENSSIYTLGYPGRKELYSCAKVLYNTQVYTYTDAKSINGCSGSGVIDIRGRLVGIIWGGYNKSDGYFKRDISVMTNIETIRKFLYKSKVLNQDVIIIK